MKPLPLFIYQKSGGTHYEAELTLRLAEISSYDMEGNYGEADEV